MHLQAGEGLKGAGEAEPHRSRLPRLVVRLGLVSLFTDASSEGIYPLLPVFLATVFQAGALAALLAGARLALAAALILLSVRPKPRPATG